jgi:integrase
VPPTSNPQDSRVLPLAALIVREHRGKPFYEAFFRYRGKQVKRRIGPAWLARDATGGDWQPRRGRVPDGVYDKRLAHVKAAGIVAEFVAEANEVERAEQERRTAGVTFREVADDYLQWLEDVRGAKPATLRDQRSVFAEPGTAYRRGGGVLLGHTMAALGDRPAARISSREIEALLTTVAKTGASPSTVNKYRARVGAVFNYGMRESTYGLPANPVMNADRRREPQRGPLVYYSSEEIEALARALADGRHRESWDFEVRDEVRAAMRAEDHQDAELVRVAAYAGLRLGELLALRWRDVDFSGHALTISRAMSAGVESSTKSGRVRRVPMPDQAAAALDRLSRREDFTDTGELVFVNVLGRALDGSAVRRRFKAARDRANIRPLRFHDLRHTYGSLLAAAGVDLVTIQAAMGHSQLATTSRYLHAKPAAEQAKVFTQAFKVAAVRPARGTSGKAARSR